MVKPKELPLVIDSYWWRLVARCCLMLGMVGPALTLVTPLFNNGFLQHQLGNSTDFLLVAGYFLLIGAALIPFKRFREWGYLCGVVFYGVLIIGTILGIFYGLGVSAVSFMLPILFWTYIEATMKAIRDKVVGENREFSK